MTTIAYRDGVLAADSAVTDRGCHCGAVDKVFRIDGRLIGAAGDLASAQAAIAWFRDGMPDERPNVGNNFEALVIEPDGKVVWYGTSLRPVQIKADYHAIGSGDQLALGAMAMGATAKQALEIACRLNTATRGPIKVLRIGGKAMAGQPKTRTKVERVMHEFKQGQLRTKSGRKVKSRDQALAIALSEQRRARSGRK